jgi:hypothetical protein
MTVILPSLASEVKYEEDQVVSLIWISLCNLCVLCVSMVTVCMH